MKIVIYMAQEFSCKDAGAPACPFEIRDENTDELVRMVQMHAKDMHNEDLSRDEVMKHVKRR